MDSSSSTNFAEIEKKWSERWSAEKVFESNPEEREKRFLTPAFPYPNSPQHIGHARTYTTTDIYARYLRLKGYNVLFPMAFHVTGTPILAMARRIGEGDKEVYEIFDKIYGIPPEKTKTLSDPKTLVMHFSKEIEVGMKEMGFSIDWRRKFYSFDPIFNRFIQWQFLKLKQLGLLVQGEHPIAWCPKDNQAVGGHDTKGDADPELKDFIWIKFHLKGSDLILMTGTTRPDALLGQSNLWVDPHGKYKIVQVKKEKWVVGEGAVEKVYDQCDPNAKVIGEISPKELIGKWVSGPIVDYELYTLPADFIDSSVGSGLVYSALEDPVDLYELRKLQSAPDRVKEYSLDQNIVAKLKPIPIINIEGMGQDLGDSIGKEFGITSADQKEKLEEAKGELNRRVFRKGVMNKSCGKYSGMTVPKCQEAIKVDLLKSRDAVMFWELNNKPIYCRCGTHLIVKLLGNQWFIDYSNESWKVKAKECLSQMNIIPEKTRAEYLATIDWLKQKACARSQGLGTRFPFDEKLVIEALSDSTIYMAFYTISHLLHGRKHEQLDEQFFDYVLLGKGTPPDKQAEGMRASFLYWYPLDSRHSGADLIRNHLPFFILNHVAIFEKKLWPKQIVTNGFVLMDGKKMSKSMGNILPLRKAIAEYGADVIRFSVVAGAEISSDTDFNRTVAEGVRSRLALISKLIEESSKTKKPAKKGQKTHSRIDLWLLSRLNRKISKAHDLYEELAIRELALELFYDVVSDLQWYSKRSAGKVNLHDFFHKWIVLISPFMPHIAEEYWEQIGGKPFVSLAKIPDADEKAIDDLVEHGEELIKTVHADIEKISGIIGKKPQKVTLCIANEQKRQLVEIAKEKKSFEGLMKEAAAQKMDMKMVSTVAKNIMKNVHSIQKPLPEQDELETLEDAVKFLESEFSCKVEVLPEAKSKHEKAKNAMPDKPAIIIE
ncbi:leucine--tRNA ligase [Candidatus Micrarchaeota archaeon]|nr:leucine--tRNA ligase [Candidatus Micrarchaeota archaeon]